MREELKPKFRIYALVLGAIIPEGRFLNCDIAKMELNEQAKRNFKPIQGTFSEEDFKEHQFYATHLPYVDPMMIKSEYVVVYDSYEYKPLDGLGDAIRNIDKVCRYLSIGMTQDIRTSVNEDVASFSPYFYQVVKIYELKNGKEIEIELNLNNRSIYYFQQRGKINDWKNNSTKEYLDEMVEFHDTVLERALKYLYRSSIGLLILDNPEKRALDHFKSMEIIINSLSTKREFKDRLDEAKLKLDLSDQDKERILKNWDDRSTFGDIAHPSEFDQVERYPNQFPIPSNVQYSGFLESTAGRLILKYYDYKKKEYLVTIERDVPKSMEGNWATVNPGMESNHFMIFTNENDKNKLKNMIWKSLADELNITEEKIVTYELQPQKKSAILRIEL